MNIQWNDTYKIGNAEIDDQHRQLFNRINLFLKATDKAGLLVGAMDMYRYTREHFSLEENLMQAINYPDRAAHIQQHNQLISRLNEVSRDIANETLNMMALKTFLTDWLLGHIRVSDAKLATYASRLEPETIS
jgi:hemerythrin